MKKLDEIEIIAKFQTVFGNKNFVSEDVELFSIGKTKAIVKIDTLVESTDIPPQMTLRQAARKSVVACVSDFAAKGIRPSFGIISVNLPLNISRSQLSQITSGFKHASKEFGIKFLGGDTNQGKEFVFNVCIFGKAKNFVKRQGAKKGDLVFVSGPFGLTGVGLYLLLRKVKTRDTLYKTATRSVFWPKPRVKFAILAKKFLTSAMDSSDGLSTTLNEMARQSKCKFVLHRIPTMDKISQFSKQRKINLEKFVFHTGEEYEFAFTVPKKYKSFITKIARATKTPIIEIGEVTNGCGVFIKKEKKLIQLRSLGYKHFK